ncbi:MAG: hypothetical protein AAF490_03750 [Chloroflexota bacterium]
MTRLQKLQLIGLAIFIQAFVYATPIFSLMCQGGTTGHCGI